MTVIYRVEQVIITFTTKIMVIRWKLLNLKIFHIGIKTACN